MTLTFLDMVKHTQLEPCSEKEIPHAQGFYLVFDDNGDFIYVGKGWLNIRVNIHFNSNAKDDYFPEACFASFFITNDESQALAYELAIYDAHVEETGSPPKRNRERPSGASTTLSRLLDRPTLKDYIARQDWNEFLKGIQVRRLV